tara:strand:- start:3901 stop:5916 length:2016 start_codon:yes stop_codon:yes gene_type:complete
MTNNVGAIKYTVEAGTADMLRAEAVIDKSLGNIAKDFDKADKAVREFDKTQKGMGRTVNSMGQVINKNGKIVESATLEYRKLATNAATSFGMLNTKVSKSAKGVNKAVAGMGRGAGMAGIQFQQFIGQVQGGQSVMLALSQQSADLGFVLGAPLLGAVAGISASLIGMLLPALFDSGKAVDELTEKMEEWKKTIGLSQEQIDFLTNKEIEANIIRAKSIAEYTKEIDVIKAGIANQDVMLSKKDLDIKVRKKLTKAQRESNKELAEQTALLQAETQAIVDSGKKIDGYNASLNKGTEETKKQKEATVAFKATLESQLVSLEQQVMALENGEEAAFRWASAQRLGMKEGELFEESVDQRITALFKLKAAQDATSKETKEKKQLSTKVQGLGQTAEEKIILTFESDLKMLKDAQDQKIEIEGDYEDRRVELRRAAEEKINALNKDSMNSQLISWEQLENQSASALTSIATGAQTGKEAIKSLAQSVLTTMIGSLIKMGIQAVIGQATTAAATSASMAAIAVAAAPAAALVSLAMAGANAPTAAAGMLSVGATATAMALSGGRQFGGGVSGGNAYRMGENGTEILKQGNKHIVIPGENGSVVPNNELGGGGVTVNINNMASGVDVQAQPSPDGKTIEIAVRQAVNEMTSQVASGNGRFMNALKGNTNVTTKASR